ncbi:MAG: hypothetical protein JSV79_06695 [Armatimonadota bacterium]|nr:MAG: hypothetical protein JSV79_06695 [Armatimonadota bacterium]
MNQWAATLAAAIVVGALVVVRRIIDPSMPAARSYQVLQLCLLVVAGVGRALMGWRPPPGEEVRRWRWPAAVPWCVVLAAAILPYLHSLRIGFLSDDFGLAAAAHEASGPLEAMRSAAFVTFYRPVSMLVWWAGEHLWAGAPAGYHVLNLLLHAGNSLLVYALGRRLIGSSYGGFLAAVLFAVHPLHVEPVAWVCCGSDLLCVGFSLVSLLWLEAHLARGAGRGGWLVLSGSLAAFLLALLSKEAALALPVVVLLRLALHGPRPRWRRAAGTVGGYGLVLVCCVAWRYFAFGGLVTYPTSFSFWNTAFPSAPLRQMGDFLFPVHRPLFLEGLGLWLWCAAMLPMAAAVLWWIRGLVYVPAWRLWLWTGYVFAAAIPVWTLSATTSGDMSGSRFAYLPTIGLAWLFGDLCAGRGIGWRRSGGVAAAVVIGAAALTIWYVVPWRQGGVVAQEIVAAGERVLGDLSESGEVRMLYVQGLPEMEFGVPVFRNCYPQALSLATGGRVGTTVGAMVVSATNARGVIHPEVLASRALAPGEHVVAWRPETGEMEVVRRGGE